MKRFLKILCLLILALFALVTGMDQTLGHLNQSPRQNSFTFYNERGDITYDYRGNLADCKAYPKSDPRLSSAPSRNLPNDSGLRWF